MPSINITVPEVAVTAPSTPPVISDINVTANEGSSSIRVDSLPQVTNDSNISQTLRITVSNLVNCTVNRLGFVVSSNLTSQNNVMVYEQTLAPNATATGDIVFGVTPGAPGVPGSTASADAIYEWV